jgi:outer membrane immunogenic protein
MLLHCLGAEAFVAPMRLARLSIAGAMLVLPLCAAAAQDPDTQGAERAKIAPQGFRIEALAGYDDEVFSDHGLLYGGRIGYDLRVARRVSLGVDVEYTDVTTDHDIKPFSNIVVKDGPDLYVGGRASFALSSRFRLHGAGGYSLARFGHFELAPGNTIVGVEETHEGYRLSAGGQFSLGRKAFIGAEYRYSQYEGYVARNQYVGTIGFRF